MKQWQSDLVAIGAGLLALIILLYGVAVESLLIRLAWPEQDPDLVGLFGTARHLLRL